MGEILIYYESGVLYTAAVCLLMYPVTQELEVSSPVGSTFLFALPQFAHQVAKLLRNSQPEV